MNAASTPTTRDGVAVTHHILSVLVENRFGVLTRVAGLFARRGFNIVSLAVSPTENEAFSRMTIVVDAESAPLEQVTKQLNKLIPVLDIVEISEGEGIERDLMLVTVGTGQLSSSELSAICEQRSATIVDQNAASVTLMAAAAAEDLDAFEQELRAFGILELQRTGRIALRRLTA
ncbi:MAG: acetolactate synthase small subunit [Acidimicrobiia bacterium]